MGNEEATYHNVKLWTNTRVELANNRGNSDTAIIHTTRDVEGKKSIGTNTRTNDMGQRRYNGSTSPSEAPEGGSATSP